MNTVCVKDSRCQNYGTDSEDRKKGKEEQCSSGRLGKLLIEHLDEGFEKEEKVRDDSQVFV